MKENERESERSLLNELDATRESIRESASEASKKIEELQQKIAEIRCPFHVGQWLEHRTGATHIVSKICWLDNGYFLRVYTESTEDIMSTDVNQLYIAK